MATHKSALKRARQNKVRRLRNMAYKSRMKTGIKNLRSAIEENSPEKARERLDRTVAIIQKTASKGVIHKNKAARLISRLSRRVNQISTPSTP
ncbi:MAG: 30S ribosomal protein S20 [Deltaproteobacteria bacterium]|nr:30S ribosomal protein S20 [Deltaproteobacteria bacterium]